MSRPAEHYLHAGGGVVLVPSRVCLFLSRMASLDSYSRQMRGRDPEIDNVLQAILISGRKHMENVSGTKPAERAELASPSQWLTTKAVATQLGITDRGARKACAEGRIEAELINGNWRVSREALQRHKRRRVQ